MAVIFLALVAALFWLYIKYTKEHFRRLEAEKTVSSLIAELERTAYEYRRELGVGQNELHTH